MAPPLSASRLNRHLGCRHASALWLAGIPEEGGEDPLLDLIRAKGHAHEGDVLARLEAEHGSAVHIDTEGRYDARREATLSAIRAGATLIYQGVLFTGRWVGLPDFLVRRMRPDGVAAWSVEDAKLARRAKAGHALQLAVYAELLAAAGEAPHREGVLHVGDGEPERLDLDGVRAATSLMMARFERFVADPVPTRGRRCAACSQCGYRPRCEAEWRAADSPVFVAGIRHHQLLRLEAAEVTTLSLLADGPGEVDGIGDDALATLVRQAAAQRDARTAGRPTVEVLPHTPGRGFGLLPAPASGDLFLDLEGDPMFPDGGLEYLFGLWGPLGDAGREGYRSFWAHDGIEEREAFEAMMGVLSNHLARNPSARIYHYAAYEPAALKRLAMRHATMEAELDDILRAQRFVDLHRVARQGLVASTETYSLKALETFYRPARQGEVGTAGDSIVAYERWRETGEATILSDIEAYNRDDCASMVAMRDWLEGLRPIGATFSVPRLSDRAPDAARTAEREAFERRRRDLATRVRGRHAGDGRIAEVVAELLWFHQRCEKPQWWALFDKQTWADADLIDDGESLGGLERDRGRAPFQDKQSIVTAYRFPPQDTKLKEGQTARVASSLETVGKVFAIDVEAGRVSIKRGIRQGPAPDSCSLLAGDVVSSKALVAGVIDFAERFASGTPADHAVRALLAREAPRLRGRAPGPLLRAGEDTGDGVVAAVRALDDSYLVVQGPPGTGKTYTAARSILALLRDGRRVAISSNSHKAIHKLLAEVASQARAAGVRFRGAKKASRDDPDTCFDDAMFENVFSSDAVTRAHQLVGGTAFHFCSDGQRAGYSHLIVDEAGQVSLGNVVAMGACASNLILIGDQMQLAQPIQGVHPGETGMSCLDYLLSGMATVPPDRGILLDVTRRMHPSLCGLISSALYDGRLTAHPSTSERWLELSGPSTLLRPAGISFVSVPHAGCTQTCEAEAATVALIIEELLRHGLHESGITRPMRLDDILVVAPFNMQVNLLRRRLPAGSRVGTVDKFQGQEAAVAIVSMTSSTAQDAPRGTEFLLNRNRINVALSRARCLAVVVHGSALSDVSPGSIDELQRLDLFAQAERAAAR